MSRMTVDEIRRSMRRSELMLLLRSANLNTLPLQPSNIPGLSPALWGTESLNMTDVENWHTPLVWQFDGALDIDCLVRAAREVFRRHALLRCTLRIHGTTWHYVPEQHADFPITEIRTLADTENADSEALQRIAETIWRSFALQSEAPFRLATARISDTRYLIACVLNHAFADAYSTRILSFELAVLYDAFRRAHPSPLPDLSVQFLDYMVSVEQSGTDPAAEYLAGAQPPRLPIDAQHRPADFELPEALSEALRQLCASEKCGPNVAWEATHQVALGSLLDQTDVTTRAMEAGRRHKELVGIMGPFASTLPIRSRIEAQLTYRDVLRHIREQHSQGSSRYRSPDASRPFAWVKADFPILNFAPRELRPLPSFGELFDVIRIPGAEQHFAQRMQRVQDAMPVWIYSVFVRDEKTYRVHGDTVLIPLVERVMRAALSKPDVPLGHLLIS